MDTPHGIGLDSSSLAFPQPSIFGPANAAQYVRMSTDHQQYSIANQLDALTKYAAEHCLTIVRTYADEGKSGLTVRGRDGLCNLLGDVMSGQADFQVILVYDVSRWGRFQDADESAFYEFLCRRCGVRVEYCMETFRNDGTPMATVMKGLKRLMAGEFSRELSEKTFRGKCRMIKLGYSVGGPAVFGLRRMLLDSNGKPKRLLQYGEWKSLSTERTVLVPGPVKEQRAVRWIFKQVAERGAKFQELTTALNKRVPTPDGRPWTNCRVQTLLVNEKYIGNVTFGMTSIKLKTPAVRNPPEQWVRKEGALAPIVDPDLFARAQQALREWPTRINDEDALDALRDLLAKHGYLTPRLINETKGIPCARFYSMRFGGLHRVYAMLGYRGDRRRDYLEGYGAWYKRSMEFRRIVSEDLRSRGLGVEKDGRAAIVIDKHCRVRICLARRRWENGSAFWMVQERNKPHWNLIACEGAGAGIVERYWLIEGGVMWIRINRIVRSKKARFNSPDVGPLLDILADPRRCAEARFRQQLLPETPLECAQNAQRLVRSGAPSS